ncbi:hypothetical protein ABEB36_007832 [Hypothenemus hampei]|uniref:Structure-specific endonuclease subunit SLX1 C-terminal domain-containing protein n=1 Tax=Hypothenemus hampei TaxID=57062 RepID=A0ABD1EVT5_HYPHA
MVLIIHGFPNDISALRFEWAWQHPHSSRRLRHVSKKKSNEKVYDFCLRVLSVMLQVGPWNRLPLTIQWLNEEFARDFPVQERPPMHMPICYGPVISKKLEKGNSISEHSPKSSQVEEQCYLCFTAIEPSKEITCVDPTCSITCHIICMSKHFLSPGQYVPVEGYCPKCFKHYLWGDIIRKFKGCYGNIDLSVQNILCCYEEN